MMNELKKTRIEMELTQGEAAKLLSISRRSYQNYEALEGDFNYKYYYYLEKIKNSIGENKGILSVSKIKKELSNLFSQYDINFCYLFGSYAKGKAKENSDIDLLIDTSITGIYYFGLIEEIREKLNKKIDLLNLDNLMDNTTLLREILKDGIKIYG